MAVGYVRINLDGFLERLDGLFHFPLAKFDETQGVEGQRVVRAHPQGQVQVLLGVIKLAKPVLEPAQVGIGLRLGGVDVQRFLQLLFRTLQVAQRHEGGGQVVIENGVFGGFLESPGEQVDGRLGLTAFLFHDAQQVHGRNVVGFLLENLATDIDGFPQVPLLVHLHGFF